MNWPSTEAHADPRTCFVAHILGTSAYRRSESGSFLALVEEIGTQEAFRICMRGQVVGLLDAALREADQTHPLLQTTAPMVRYQRLHARLLIDELSELGGKLHRAGIVPVALKGPGLWGSAYRDPASRLARDLDLLIQGAEAMRRACDIFESCGYRCEDPAVRDQINDESHYELSEFIKERELVLSAEDRLALEACGRLASYSLHMEPVSGERYRAIVLLEPHKAPFIYSGGGRPSLGADLLAPHGLVESCQVLRTAALLPYTAIKFVQDCETFLSGTDWMCKAPLKLMGDFIRVLKGASQVDISESIALAKSLSAATHYRQALEVARPMMPEVAFRNLAAPASAVAFDDVVGAM